MKRVNKFDIFAAITITFALLPTTLYLDQSKLLSYYRILSAIIPLTILFLFLPHKRSVNFLNSNAQVFQNWYLILFWVFISAFLTGNLVNSQFINKMLPTLVSFILALNVGWKYINMQNRQADYMKILYYAMLVHCIVFFLHTLLFVGSYWIFPFGAELVYAYVGPFKASLYQGAGYTTLGVFSGNLVILSIYYFRQTGSKFKKIFFVLVMLFGLFLNFSSGNRASVVGLLSLPLIYIILASIKINKVFLKMGLTIFFYLLIGFLMVSDLLLDIVVDRGLADVRFLGKGMIFESINSRLSLYQNIWNRISIDKLIVGYKWDLFFGGNGQLSHPHNLLVEQFFVGGLLCLILAINSIVKVLKSLLLKFWVERKGRSILTPLLLGFIFFFFLFLTNNWNHQSAPLFGFWIVSCVYHSKKLNPY